MMPSTPFSWRCPFCNQNATIVAQNYSANMHFPSIKGEYWRECSLVEFTVCPNPKCNLASFAVHLLETNRPDVGQQVYAGKIIKTWSLIPASNAKVFPDYVPAPIRDDYIEACAIKELSPKASATLARRALQGMIRDYWEITRYNLKQEIIALQEKVDPLVWQAIDGVREVGNIGAHMEKNINHIVEVEPDEAGKLIGLVEYLVDDWYVGRRNRELQLEAVVGLARDKKAEQQSSGPSDESPPPSTN